MRGTRLDRLNENELVVRVAELRRELDELKGLQFAGSGSVNLTRTQTANTSDFTAVYDYNVIHGWEIKWTPADTSRTNLGPLFYLLFSQVSSSGSGTLWDYTYTPRPGSDGSQTIQFWTLNVTSGASKSVAYKMSVYAVGAGTISVSQIQ